MNFFETIRLVWGKLSLVQQALLISIVLAFVIAGWLLTHWAGQPEMRLLYQQLDAEEASKIADKISEKNVPYELRSGGTSIYVPEAMVYQLRLDMAKEGLPSGQQGGYSIFDNEKIGISPFVQNVNLKRALQDELAKSIQMINGVDYARVHIVSTEQTLFSSEEQNTTASIILRLKSGYEISNLNIAAITHLVAGGVEGLESKNVTVIDSEGHLLSTSGDDTAANGAGTVQDYKERVERNLARKVEDMLTTVLGPGRATVTVSAEIDMTRIESAKESYDPKGVPVKEEIKEKKETKADTVSADGKSTVPGDSKTDNNMSTEYQYGKTVETKIVLPGEIKSLKVAAIVDLSAPEATNEEQAESPTSAEGIMTEPEVVEIIQNALGIEDAAVIKVVNTKFNRQTEPLAEYKPSNWSRYIEIARHGSLGIMAICALLVLRVFSSKNKASAGGAGGGQLAKGGGAAGLLPAGGEGSGPAMLRRQIAGSLQNDPEGVKQLFANWLEEKEE